MATGFERRRRSRGRGRRAWAARLRRAGPSRRADPRDHGRRRVPASGLRFLGLTGIDGLEEVPRYLFVWLVMIGAASAMQRGQHTVLDYFVNLLGSARPRAACSCSPTPSASPSSPT